jgi:hypothetical protein
LTFRLGQQLHSRREKTTAVAKLRRKVRQQ